VPSALRYICLQLSLYNWGRDVHYDSSVIEHNRREKCSSVHDETSQQLLI
jgi:hypothetical protein